MLRYNHCISDIVTRVNAGSFYAGHHQTIFAAIVRLWNAGRPVDLVTVAEQLGRDVGSEKTAKVTYAELSELWDAAPTPDGAGDYAKIVRDRAVERDLLKAAQELAGAIGKTEATELLEATEKRILGIADLGAEGCAVHISVALAEVKDAIDRRATGQEPPGVAVKWPDLREIVGDFRGGESCVVAARLSVGKTAFALDIARRAAQDGTVVLVVSLEQSRAEIVERLIAAISGVPCQKLRSGSLSESDANAICRAQDALRSPPIFIDDQCAQSMMRIGANARRVKRKHGLGLVVIDYIQLIRPENPKEPREQQVAGISRRIKWLARELGVPVIALAQLNRACEQEGRRPRASDLRESDAVGQDADKVLLLWKPPSETESPVDIIEVIVAKHRNGRTGMCGLAFKKDCMVFDSLAQRYAPPGAERRNGKPQQSYADREADARPRDPDVQLGEPSGQAGAGDQ